MRLCKKHQVLPINFELLVYNSFLNLEITLTEGGIKVEPKRIVKAFLLTLRELSPSFKKKEAFFSSEELNVTRR